LDEHSLAEVTCRSKAREYLILALNLKGFCMHVKF